MAVSLTHFLDLTFFVSEHFVQDPLGGPRSDRDVTLTVDDAWPPNKKQPVYIYIYIYIWSNYSDLTRPHPKWWFSKGNLLFQGNLGW